MKSDNYFYFLLNQLNYEVMSIKNEKKVKFKYRLSRKWELKSYICKSKIKTTKNKTVKLMFPLSLLLRDVNVLKNE